MKQLDSAIHNGPLGNIRVVMDDGILVLLDFEENQERSENLLKKRYGAYSMRTIPCCEQIQKSLDNYFSGDWKAFDLINMDPAGTPFQQAVWDALKRIPAGKSCAYSELAAEIGKPRAARAVGSANANNPIAIMIPCHRVIARQGHVSGYAGGVDRQRWLLRHEGAI